MNKRMIVLVSGSRNALILVLITGFVFVFGEGLSSVALALYRVFRAVPGVVTQYDEELGWVGIAKANVPNKYGMGNYVRTNSRGFRNDREFTKSIPDGKMRIICAGDSFTYGQGVANDETWCYRLSELDSRFETVNLGEMGYGVDQIYLHYLRDGLDLEHSILVFAFVAGDFDRMAHEEQSGHGKPVLTIEGDMLVPKNVPVPRLRWTIHRALKTADLRSLELARGLLARLRRPPSAIPEVIEQVGPLANAIFRSIQDICDESGVIPIFVYLPTEVDLYQEKKWRGWLASTMDDLGARYVDLTPDLRATPAGQASYYFIRKWKPGGGHYTELGNDWAAALLFDRIIEVLQVQEQLDG